MNKIIHIDFYHLSTNVSGLVFQKLKEIYDQCNTVTDIFFHVQKMLYILIFNVYILISEYYKMFYCM